MTFEEIPNWIKAIGAAVTGIYTAYKVAFKPFRDYFKIKNERNQAMAVIAEKIPFILMAANKLMEKNDILWYRADKNGYTVEVSPQLCNILGYSEEELKKEVGEHIKKRMSETDWHYGLNCFFNKQVKDTLAFVQSGME